MRGGGAAVGHARNSLEEEKNHEHPKCRPGKLGEHCFLSDQGNFTSVFQITHMLGFCWSLFLSGKDKLPPALSALAQQHYRACSPRCIFLEQIN